MSVRITATTASTNNHSAARRPSRTTVRVSSLMSRGSALPAAEREPSPAHRDAVALGEDRARDPVAVDERAVRRAEVADVGDEARPVTGHPDLGVPPGATGAVEDHVDVVPAADDRDRGEKWVGVAVDVEPGPAGGRDRLGRLATLRRL